MPRNRGRPYIDIELALGLYSTGNYTIDHISYILNLKRTTLYYALRNAGCKFVHKWRKEESIESKIKRSIARKGVPISNDVRKAISEKNSCNYNGINGYGHTKIHNRGYVLVYVPMHPRAHKDGYVMLHTVLMERYIGRYLTNDEVVHHINHDRQDNRIDNLRLMKKKDHMSMHMKERHEKRRGLTLTA